MKTSPATRLIRAARTPTVIVAVLTAATLVPWKVFFVVFLADCLKEGTRDTCSIFLMVVVCVEAYPVVTGGVGVAGVGCVTVVTAEYSCFKGLEEKTQLQ